MLYYAADGFACSMVTDGAYVSFWKDKDCRTPLWSPENRTVLGKMLHIYHLLLLPVERLGQCALQLHYEACTSWNLISNFSSASNIPILSSFKKGYVISLLPKKPKYNLSKMYDSKNMTELQLRLFATVKTM